MSKHIFGPKVSSIRLRRDEITSAGSTRRRWCQLDPGQIKDLAPQSDNTLDRGSRALTETVNACRIWPRQATVNEVERARHDLKEVPHVVRQAC